MNVEQRNRRRFLKRGAGLAGLAVAAIRSANGQTTETSTKDLRPYGERSRFEKLARALVAPNGAASQTPLQDSMGIITPSSLHFVVTRYRNNPPDIDPAQHKLNLSHVPIPEIGWPAMTMDFPVAPAVDLKAIKPYQNGIPFFVANVDLGGVRTSLSVPLIESGRIIGVFICMGLLAFLAAIGAVMLVMIAMVMLPATTAHWVEGRYRFPVDLLSMPLATNAWFMVSKWFVRGIGAPTHIAGKLAEMDGSRTHPGPYRP